MPGKLILVKHALPEMDARLPASRWRLSEEGRMRCQALAERLALYRPGYVISSQEPKAWETARLVAARLGAPAGAAPGLHEHERGREALTSQQAFQAEVERLFAHPGEQVFGEESANQARDRFSGALAAVLAQFSGENLAVVAHGTVISLWIAQHSHIEAFSLWKQLGLPSFAVLSLPSFSLDEVVAQV